MEGLKRFTYLVDISNGYVRMVIKRNPKVQEGDAMVRRAFENMKREGEPGKSDKIRRR